ncbi:cytosol aminopeptidase [Tiliqua scincoides]|uniref:cytosol aminopeptidase n=1 Tax=Tiliqua scincoides TaxID=71010 RepID=UPI0034621F42
MHVYSEVNPTAVNGAYSQESARRTAARACRSERRAPPRGGSEALPLGGGPPHRGRLPPAIAAGRGGDHAAAAGQAEAPPPAPRPRSHGRLLRLCPQRGYREAAFWRNALSVPISIPPPLEVVLEKRAAEPGRAFQNWHHTGSWCLDGLILGAFASETEDGPCQFTKAGEAFNSCLSGKLKELLAISGPPLKKGKTRIFHGLHQDFSSVIVVGLGKKGAGVNKHENWNEDKENIRTAVAVGCRQFQDLEVPCVEVDPCGDAQAAAEGAILGLFDYDELKTKKKPKVEVQLHKSGGIEAQDEDLWKKGCIYADGQNLARSLMEGPANYITPTRFAAIIKEELGKAAAQSGKVTVHTRDKSWIEAQKMGSFFSVAKGSDEPPVFLEIHYQGSNDASEPPLIFVGKGITFDSGGISIKPSANMDAMRADMGGAATISSAIVTAVKLKLPLNMIGLTPLCENMPSGRANKPGDVVTAMNGKTIQVDNTDAEGRLVLADALFYAHSFKPRAIVDAATLTGAMVTALGSAATGVFTNSCQLWNQLYEASIVTGDRVWRMPLFEHYTKQVTDCQLADVNNVGKYKSGGACTAAAFLKEFVTISNWAHLDIAGVMDNIDEVPYLRKGMAGRPTRTLVEFATRLSQDKKSI